MQIRSTYEIECDLCNKFYSTINSFGCNYHNLYLCDRCSLKEEVEATTSYLSKKIQKKEAELKRKKQKTSAPQPQKISEIKA